MKRIIYQALVRLWGKGRLDSWDNRSLSYLKELGVDYLWLTGIPRHASGKSFVKGDPGCPYSISDWYDINPYLESKDSERFEEFGRLVKRIHRSGLKLLIDFIPNHVSRDYQGPLPHYDYCDGDWTDTLKLNWEDPSTLEQMKAVLRFWAAKGVDGFRCDMVELVRSDAQRELIRDIKKDYPDCLFVAEVYDRKRYREFSEYVGYDLLYDKCGLYDILFGISKGWTSPRSITRNWQSLSGLQGRMLNFLENHDEVRLASGDFAASAQKGYAALGVSMLFNDASFMLYFGQEVGENAAESSNCRTSIFDFTRPEGISALYRSLHSKSASPSILGEEREAILNKYRSLLAYARLKEFREGGCWDLCYCNEKTSPEGFDPDSHFAFVRYSLPSDKGKGRAFLVVCNFSSTTLKCSVSIPSELSQACRMNLPESAAVSVPGYDVFVTELPTVAF